MGLFSKGSKKKEASTKRPAAFGERPTWMVTGAQVTAFDGDETLELVGESQYQDALWSLVGGMSSDYVRHEVHAVLVAETDNPYDPNAVAAWINGWKVGYLSRDDARRYRPGLLALERTVGTPVALGGVIVGGGQRGDGLGRLGVYLRHDPADFGLARGQHSDAGTVGHLRTGRSEVGAGQPGSALRWLSDLSPDQTTAIKELRRLLVSTARPIDRHFMHAELAQRLYRCRDTFTSALDEFDDVCSAHDADMDAIRPALMEEFGGIPLLETYKQMCIRQQKAHQWEQVVHWAERGIEIYAGDALNPAVVDDLRDRAAKAKAKLAAPRVKTKKPTPPHTSPSIERSSPTIEHLVCRQCGATFERIVTRGRKPRSCPTCRSSASTY